MQLKKYFLILSNSNITFKNHYKELMEFQINRINHFYPRSCWIFDPDRLAENTIQYEQIFSSPEELKKWCGEIDKNTLLFIIDSINPFIDMELIEHLTIQFTKKKETLGVYGAIPGTTPNLMTSSNLLFEHFSNLDSFFKNSHVSIKKTYWDTQRKHNIQFDLNRGLRIKIFLKLIKEIESLYKLSLDDFVKVLNDDKIYNLILDYAVENLNTKEVISCPYCKSVELKPLYLSTNQTMIGFLSNSKPLYYECMNCSLVVLKRQCDIADVKSLYDEYERPKVNEEEIIESYLKNHGTSHYVEKIKGLELIEPLLPSNASMADLGGGFGEFACIAKHRNPKWDIQCVDFNLDHVQKLLSKYGVKTINANFFENNFGNNYDVITSLHVIEHIPFDGLLGFFKNIHRSLKDDGFFLLSTPDYDSPLGKFFDYHLMYPPHHQTILSSSWIEKFVNDNGLFHKIRQESACVILERFDPWFSYYKNTSPNDELRSTVEIFEMIQNNTKLFKDFEESVSSNKMGSETILLLQKQ